MGPYLRGQANLQELFLGGGLFEGDLSGGGGLFEDLGYVKSSFLI